MARLKRVNRMKIKQKGLFIAGVSTAMMIGSAATYSLLRQEYNNQNQALKFKYIAKIREVETWLDDEFVKREQALKFRYEAHLRRAQRWLNTQQERLDSQYEPQQRAASI
jgi:hypothetical protein